MRRVRAWYAAAAGAATVAVVVVVALVLGGEDEPVQGPAAQGDALPVVMEDGEVLVTCGGLAAWPPSVMADGVPGVLDDAEARGIFQSILDDPDLGGEAELSLFGDGIDVDWRVLRDDGSELTLGLGEWTEAGHAVGAWVLGLERDGDRWVPTGWGDCGLEPVLRDDQDLWVEITGYTTAGTSIEAAVSERQCTSARDPTPFLHDPVVVESPDVVTIYWTSAPVEGSAVDCQGNPSVNRVVELAEPLGDRQVLDGSFYPPRRVPRS